MSDSISIKMNGRRYVSSAKPGRKGARVHPFLSEQGILIPVILLSGIGIIMVYSASSAISMENHNTLFYYMKKQTIFFFISLGVMFITASFPYRLYRKFSYIILITAIGLLTAVLLPSLNVKAGGAHRWLDMGAFTFQPAEFGKLALILFLGYSLTKKQNMINIFSIGFMPHVSVLFLFSFLIIIQPDFGTIVVMTIITWGMMFVAGVKFIHLLSPVPLIVPVIYFWIYKVQYRLERILTFLNPWSDPYDTGYQITHSLKAFGSGGIWGKGIGMGIQKMHYLPEPHTDFIFSVIGEELGLIGSLGVLGLYIVLITNGFKIAKRSESFFGTITATGLTMYIGIHVIINTGVTLGVLPTKGLTLPFISYGGTSLLINMAAMGILMNIGASQKNAG